jgi:tRNA (guanine37-N1)-methyltransferase
MQFTFVTLFENLISGYFTDSILKRAINANIFRIDYLNPRKYTKNKHQKVDDYAVGGGAGLTMMAQPLYDAFDALKQTSPNAKIIMMTPSGKPFKQSDAVRLANEEHIVFLSGRYEGIDERVIEKYVDECFVIGDYILTGGELPSLVMCDAIARNIEGVLGNDASLDEESFNGASLEAPSFTKPTTYAGCSVPSMLLSGHHKKMKAFRDELADAKTKYFRPDLKLVKNF